MDIQTAQEVSSPAALEKPVDPVDATPTPSDVATKQGDNEQNISADSSESDYLSDEEWTRLSKKKRKVPIGKEQFEMTLEEIARNTAINKSVTEKGQRVSEAEKRAREYEAEVAAREDRLGKFLLAAKSDPAKLWELAQQLGHDPEQIAIQRAREAYEWSQKSEIEKEAIIAKRERDAVKAELEEIRGMEIQKEQDFAAQQVESEIENDIISTLKELNVEPDVINAERIAQGFQFLYNRDEKKPTPKEVAEFVRETMHKDVLGYVSRLSAEEAVKVLPKEFLNALQSHIVKQAEKNLPYAPSKRTSAKDSEPAKSEKGVSWRDILAK